MLFRIQFIGAGAGTVPADGSRMRSPAARHFSSFACFCTNRFDVAWAGGFGGPDFFIFVGDGFYDAGEIVFGSVEGAASQALVMAISKMKWITHGEDSMRFLDPEIEFDVGGS